MKAPIQINREMKSKEEIEQLAKQLCNIPIDLVLDKEERYYRNLKKYDGIVQGYTQCQEDMAIEIAELKIICQEYSKDVKALNDMLSSIVLHPQTWS